MLISILLLRYRALYLMQNIFSISDMKMMQQKWYRKLEKVEEDIEEFPSKETKKNKKFSVKVRGLAQTKNSLNTKILNNLVTYL